MSLDSQLMELKRRHQAVERALAVEKARRGADDLTILELKRRTLLLREAIERRR